MIRTQWFPNLKDPREHETPKVVGKGRSLLSCKKGVAVGQSFWEIFMAIVKFDIVKQALRSSQNQDLLDHEKRTPEEIFALIRAGYNFDVRITLFSCLCVHMLTLKSSLKCFIEKLLISP